ncbi:alpha/beta hydrolase [Oscillatoria sp. FACHB-1407]|uniref:alpha/beta hydrolase n=1 Tax=Oscillatoria sp. FACHB-1407 TaxID=2692847 RepID=UPI001684BE90|nr:alpha/beta hydrolase [Oscillatoria sp. FACHB-1407]MBD2461720.1 alpha/beta hydrolase [Oscillatoria sp. FACHB-1407]
MKSLFASFRWLSLSVVGLLLVAYGGICLYLYFRQTRFIFFPSPYIETTPDEFGMAYEDVWLSVGNGNPPAQLHSWWIPAQSTSRGVVLYLHGNGANIGANVAQAERFHRLGLSVLLIDYRGYGKSTGGFPSEVKVYEDAAIAWNYLTQERQIPPQQILLYGHSLGGAIATQLAIQQPDAAGLIVQCSFTSIREMTNRMPPYRLLPIDLVLTQRFDSIHKVPRLQMPVLFIHGIADTEVPADMSQSLFDAAPEPKRLWLVPGAGHNNVGDTAGAEYLRVVEQFVQETIPNPAVID